MTPARRHDDEAVLPRLKRHLRELEVQIDRQRAIVAEQRAAGEPNERATGLLRGMETLAEHYQADLNRLG